ncbi:MAG: NHL repeat-containing protein [Candidatus Zixiibacteriota bacterium]
MSTPRATLVLVLLLTSCTRPPQREELPTAAQVPVAIVVERAISGEILGQRLRRPFGLAVDSRGAGYLVDGGNNRILKFAADLTFTEDIGGFGAAEGLFNRPTYVTIDNELNLLVADEGNRRICRYNSRLEFVETIPFSDADDPLKFGLPSGIGVSDYGELWVADRERHRLAVFNNVGSFERFMGEFGAAGGQVRSPAKIARSRHGNFLVCDAGNGRIVVYDEYGNFERDFGRDYLAEPVAAIADAARIWVLDKSSSKILLFDARGRPVFEAGPMLPGTDNAMKETSDLVFFSDDQLLISDTGNDRLLVCRVISGE